MWAAAVLWDFSELRRSPGARITTKLSTQSVAGHTPNYPRLFNVFDATEADIVFGVIGNAEEVVVSGRVSSALKE